MSQKFRLSNLGLYSLLFLLLAFFSAAISLENLQQVEQSQAEDLKMAFESHFRETGLEFAFLDDLKTTYQTDWQIFLRSTTDLGNPPISSPEASIPNTDLKLRASTLAEPYYEPAQAYRDALAGKARVSEVQLPTESGASYNRGYRFPIRDAAGNTIGVGEVFWDISPQARALQNQLLLSLAAFCVILLLGALQSMRMIEKEFSPLKRLVDFSNRIRQGEYPAQIPEEGEGDQAALATHLNAIASRLAELSGNLDDMVVERTRDLERQNRQIQTVAEIASQIAAPHHLEVLLTTTVSLIH
jgi:methyl-accepting chemotaxis protein